MSSTYIHSRDQRPLWSFHPESTLLLHVRNPRSNTVLELRPAGDVEEGLDEAFRPLPRLHDGQVATFVRRGVLDVLVLRPQLAQDTDDVVPVERLRERKQSLVLDCWVKQRRDVDSSVVSDVDEPFWTTQLAKPGLFFLGPALNPARFG